MSTRLEHYRDVVKAHKDYFRLPEGAFQVSGKITFDEAPQVEHKDHLLGAIKLLLKGSNFMCFDPNDAKNNSQADLAEQVIELTQELKDTDSRIDSVVKHFNSRIDALSGDSHITKQNLKTQRSDLEAQIDQLKGKIAASGLSLVYPHIIANGNNVGGDPVRMLEPNQFASHGMFNDVVKRMTVAEEVLRETKKQHEFMSREFLEMREHRNRLQIELNDIRVHRDALMTQNRECHANINAFRSAEKEHRQTIEIQNADIKSLRSHISRLNEQSFHMSREINEMRIRGIRF